MLKKASVPPCLPPRPPSAHFPDRIDDAIHVASIQLRRDFVGVLDLKGVVCIVLQGFNELVEITSGDGHHPGIELHDDHPIVVLHEDALACGGEPGDDDASGLHTHPMPGPLLRNFRRRAAVASARRFSSAAL